MIFYLSYVVMIIGQCVHNPHKSWPFLVNDFIVALNKITYFKCFEFVNSHFITTKNNLHFHQPSAMQPKLLSRNQVYSIWTTPENENEDKKREQSRNQDIPFPLPSLFTIDASGKFGDALLANLVVLILQNIGIVSVGGQLRE